MEEQNQESELTLLRMHIERENYFAYATDGHTSLRQILSNEDTLTKTRMDAEREMVEKIRVDDPTNQASAEQLLEKNQAQIWDLREMLDREE